jgi:peptidoglycan/xylan/chitin deacetylase (PgdA/CDA1 family)
MAAELCILIPLFILYYFGYIPIYLILIIYGFIYWLPKFFFIQLLEFFYPKVLTRVKSSKHIALTFDDVPYGSFEQILKELDKHQMKATFFIVSGDVDQITTNLLIEAVRNGHQLANHGETNSVHFFKSEKGLSNEISKCKNLIDNIYESAKVSIPENQFYRPGAGLFNGKMINFADKFGYKLALGSVYPNDPVIQSSTINYYYLINHICPGDIVIVHDRKWTPKMLIRLLNWMKSNNLKSVTLNELVENKLC